MIIHEINDNGGKVFAVNLRQAAAKNTNYRTAVWTGKEMQVTLMSIPVRSDVGLEKHTGLEQMITVAFGSALVRTGQTKENMSGVRIGAGDTVFIPENTWHNVINTGRTPLKLISVYAPPQHPFGTAQTVKPEEH